MNGGVIQKINGTLRTKGQGFRANAGVVLWLLSQEKKIVEDELKRHDADALENVGIMAHDPRWLPFPVTPAELLVVLQKSNRFVKKNYYPKTEE